jgi:hypothetical protein
VPADSKTIPPHSRIPETNHLSARWSQQGSAAPLRAEGETIRFGIISKETQSQRKIGKGIQD